MGDMVRRKSLRLAVRNILSKRKKTRYSVGKLKGRGRFRAAYRLVLEFKDWLFEDVDAQDVDVSINVKMAQRRKLRGKKALTIKDRAILLIDPYERVQANREHISQLLKSLGAFKKYPDIIRNGIAAVCRYQYIPAGRTIVKQGHKAENLYYIVNGEASLSRSVTDNVTGDTMTIDAGVIGPGDMFGEVALLQQIPRTATVVTKTAVDLLYLFNEDFERLLRDSLLEEWDVLRDAMINFNYFKGWKEDTIRECCILSKIKTYEPNQVLLGDGKGMVNYVYFVLSGKCKLIEHLLVEEKSNGKKSEYRLYNPEKVSKTEGGEKSQMTGMKKAAEPRESIFEYAKFSSKDVEDDVLKDRYRSSVVTVTLLDVVNQWHEITDVSAMLMRQPSTASEQNYPRNVRTVFMQICTFYRGACFGLGENMQNRRIVSTTSVKCLLIPRYWLLEHNRGNIWERVKLFIDSKYPTRQELFQEFIRNRRWLKFKNDLVSDTLQLKGRQRAHNDTKIHDVPYFIRIHEGIDAHF